MKFLSLLTWVTQFGISLVVPPCLLLFLATTLQAKYGWGTWVVILFGILGLLISFRSARSAISSMCKAAEENSGEKKEKENSPAFNDHH